MALRPRGLWCVRAPTLESPRAPTSSDPSGGAGAGHGRRRRGRGRAAGPSVIRGGSVGLGPSGRSGRLRRCGHSCRRRCRDPRALRGPSAAANRPAPRARVLRRVPRSNFSLVLPPPRPRGSSLASRPLAPISRLPLLRRGESGALSARGPAGTVRSGTTSDPTADRSRTSLGPSPPPPPPPHRVLRSRMKGGRQQGRKVLDRGRGPTGRGVSPHPYITTSFLLKKWNVGRGV